MLAGLRNRSGPWSEVFGSSVPISIKETLKLKRTLFVSAVELLESFPTALEVGYLDLNEPM